jgi:hypothetical protein
MVGEFRHELVVVPEELVCVGGEVTGGGHLSIMAEQVAFGA